MPDKSPLGFLFTKGKLIEGRFLCQQDCPFNNNHRMNRLTVSILGAGNVGCHLATALSMAGYTIAQVWSRQFAHASQLAQQVGARPLSDLQQLDTTSDLYILSVSDDAIPTVANCLHLGNHLLVHTAGSVSIDTLQAASTRYGVIWPVQSLVAHCSTDYSQIPFCIEGCSPEAESDIASVVASISPHCYHLDGEQRRWAHLFASMVSNFGNALNAIAQSETSRRGIDFDLLRPLIAATAGKATDNNLWQLQTGPAVRHDSATIQSHRTLLSGNPQLCSLYDIFTNLIQTYCPRNN